MDGYNNGSLINMLEDTNMSIEAKAHAEGVFQGQVLAFLKNMEKRFDNFDAHILADDKNFKEIREAIANIKSEISQAAKAADVADVKVAMARYAGGAAVIGALAGTVIPIIIQQLIK